MGEGAAALIIEELEHARNRGAHIYAELLGYSLNNDAFHMTAPLPNGESSIRAMREALADAQLPPDQIDYINAHASSTQLNDSTETLSIKETFGTHAARIPVSGTKGYTGHPLGATGAIEATLFDYTTPHWVFLDPKLEADFARIGREVSGFIDVICRDQADRKHQIAVDDLELLVGKGAAIWRS